MISTFARARLPRVLNPIAGFLSRLGVTPNQLTVVGLLLQVGIAVVLAEGYLLVGGILILILSPFDMLDGALARHTRRASPFGAFLDSTVDRIAEAAILGGLIVFLLRAGDSLGVVAAYLALVGSFLVSYTRARAEGLGLHGESGLVARPERLVLLSLALILNQAVIGLWVLAALTFLT
ncbi:MAG: CDP-alcohol phosphatidyltransferase family protein, partial [Chloroflexota bacterium]